MNTTNRSFLFWINFGENGVVDSMLSSILYPCRISKLDKTRKTIQLESIEDPILSKKFIFSGYGFKGQKEMMFYTGSEPELYRLIRRNKYAIKNCFIDHLIIDSLIDKQKTGKFISSRISFEDCIILNIKEPEGFGPNSTHKNAPGKENTDSLVFKSVFSFKNSVIDFFTFTRCAFRDSVIVNNCIPIFNKFSFTGNVNFTNSTFYAPVSINTIWFINSLQLTGGQPDEFNWLYNIKAGDRDSVYEKIILPTYNRYAWGKLPKDTISTSYNFKHCVFNELATFENVNRQTSLTLFNESFKKPVKFNVTKEFDNDANPNQTFYNLDLRNEDSISKAKGETKFYSGLDFSKIAECRNCSFYNIYFYDTINLSAVTFSNKDKRKDSSFWGKNCYFGENAKLVINPSNVSILSLLNIHPTSLKNSTILSDQETLNISPTEPQLQELQSFYSDVNQVVSTHYNSDIAAFVKEKLNHQYLQNEARYFKSNFWKGSNGFKYARYLFLETSVGNGYNGEIPFIRLSLIVVLIFSVLYFFLCLSHVIEFMVVEYEKDSDKGVNHDRNFVNFLRCFWLSCVILLNPKFPTAFFKQEKRIFLLFTFQWILSLIMIVLFLVYIASKYNFIKAITGL